VPKRKKEDSSGGLIVIALQLLGVILVLASFLAIFALVGAWLYFEWAIKGYQGVESRDDFKLTPEDQKRLRDFTLAKTRIKSRLGEISELRHTLPLKADGSFDNRNKEGRNLNSELQTLRAELEQCDRIIDKLSGQEQSDFSRWATIRSGLYSSRAAMLAAPVIAVILFVKTPASIVELSAFIERQTGLPSVTSLQALYGIVAATTGAAMLMFLLSWGIGRWIALRPNAG